MLGQMYKPGKLHMIAAADHVVTTAIMITEFVGLAFGGKRVAFLTALDNQAALDRKIAGTCEKLKISRSDLDGRLIAQSVAEDPVHIAALNANGDPEVIAAAVQWRERHNAENKIEVLGLNPLGAFHRVHARNELDMQIVAAAFAGIATGNECCVTFGNPLTKGTREPSGAADLLYAMHSIRIVTPMTTERADKFGIAVRERSRYVRVESRTGPIIEEIFYRLDGADLLAVPFKPPAARRAVTLIASDMPTKKQSRRSRQKVGSLEAKPLGSAA